MAWHGRGGLSGVGFAAFALLIGTFAFTQSANALTTVSARLGDKDSGRNDCAGFFNPPGTSGFNACNVWIDNNGEPILLSPVIAKIGVDNNGTKGDPTDDFFKPTKYNTHTYPSLGAGEFSATGPQGSSGNFTYSPTGADPLMKYWAVKAGPSFLLSWQVNDATNCTGTASDAGNFNLACLNAAVAFSGTMNWTTGNGKQISHITIYDTEPARVIPIPAALPLFLTALAGAGLLARRRRTLV